MHHICDLYKKFRTFVKIMKGLSILIPTYNDECLTLVKDLLLQCEALSWKEADFEIIVADDGSTDRDVIETNKTINTLPHCRIIFRETNAGRAAIRNFLAAEARYASLLFIDSDMTIIRNDFVGKYISYSSSVEIIYGGYDVPRQSGMNHNLRYIYERSCLSAHTSEKRGLHPYNDFHTSNFMVPKTIMMEHPLDENFRNYGYEDVAYGEELRKAGIKVRHIDNPMGFCRFEDNAAFISKTEEGLRTLAKFRSQLLNYSRLLSIIKNLKNMHLAGFFHLLLAPWLPVMRRKLTGNNPDVKVFSLYKLNFLLNVFYWK